MRVTTERTSKAVVASAVLTVSVNGNPGITVALSKSSLAGCARAGAMFNIANSRPRHTNDNQSPNPLSSHLGSSARRPLAMLNETADAGDLERSA
jgi:hypothetical protein